MSTPPDVLAQILQGGLLGMPQQSQQPGLLNSLMSSPSGMLGVNMLANSNSPGNFGSLLAKSIQQTQADAQNNAMNQLKLLGTGQDLRSQMFGQQLMAARFAQAQGGQPTGQPQGAVQPSVGGISAPPPMLQAPGYQGYVPSQPGTSAQSQQPQPSQDVADNFFTPPSRKDIASTPVGGMDPTLAQLYSEYMFKKDPVTAQKEIESQQYEQAQHGVAPRVALLDNLIKSPSPAATMQADPRLMAAWPALARSQGLDPQKGLTDDNVRAALSTARNQLASSVGLPTAAPEASFRTVPTGLGGSYQINRATGEIKPGAPAQETAPFVGKDGTIHLMTKAQGISQGLAPYEAGTYVNPAVSTPIATQIANYKLPPLNGMALRTPQGQDTMRQVMALNPNYDATQYQTKAKAREAFATGPQGNIVRSLSVATDHLNQLADAAVALQNGDYSKLNSIKNAYRQQTGNPAVTNFDSMKEIVGDEVVKAVVGTSGASGDREAIKSTFSNAQSPQQLLQAIQKYKGLMGGQLRGLKQQYQKSTGLNDFDDMVSQTAQSELGGQSTSSLGVGKSQTVNGYTITRVR